MVGFVKTGDCWFGGRLFRLAPYSVLSQKQLHRGGEIQRQCICQMSKENDGTPKT